MAAVTRPPPVPMVWSRWVTSPGSVHAVVLDDLSDQKDTTHDPPLATVTAGAMCEAGLESEAPAVTRAAHPALLYSTSWSATGPARVPGAVATERASPEPTVLEKTAACRGSEFWVVTRVHPSGALIALAVLLVVVT